MNNPTLLVLAAGLAVTSPARLQSETEATGLAPTRDAGAWADFDGDGRTDVLVIEASGAATLLQNHGDGRFEPCAGQVGLAEVSGLRRAAWRDHDADGDPDLFALDREGRLLALRNDGGSFVDATAELGLAAWAGVQRTHWTDFDTDGLDDLVLTMADGYHFLHNAGGDFVERSSLAVDAPSATFGSVGVTGTDVPAPAGLDAQGRPTGPGSLHSGAGRPDATIVGVTRIGGATDGSSTGLCVDGLLDQNGGPCIQASNLPALGMLFPMSLFFNVNPSTANVGIGTTAPSAQVHAVAIGTKPAVRGDSSSFSAGMFFGGSSQPALWGENTGTGLGSFIKPRLGVGLTTLGLPNPRVELGLDGASAGELEIDRVNGVRTVWIQSQEATDGAQLSMYTATGTLTAELDAEAGTRGGEFKLFTKAGTETVEISAEEVDGNGAQIVLRKADGTATIILDAEQSGDGRITTQELQITGGADLVEHFDTSCGPLEPGTVLVIDADLPGRLCTSDAPYDRRVAGVVSGAGGVRPGIFLGQEGLVEGDTPVALTGRVYVRCSAENGPVQPGDLLTSASLAGHAMRVDDFARANGAVIGKAMSSLEEGTGLVLVLVGLQ